MQQIHKITQPFPEIQDLTKAFIDIYLDAKKKSLKNPAIRFVESIVA